MPNRLTQFTLFRAWANRPFVLLWSGQTLSRIGDHLYQVALAWWVLQETGSAAAMATVLIFALAPTVLFALYGGVIVDRYPRLPILIGSDVVRGITTLLVAFLAWQGELILWQVYALSFIFGVVDGFFQPAFTATVPAMVPGELLPSANSLNSFGIQAGRILGPPLGAAVIALGGVESAFAVNGLTFFVSALFMLPLLRQEIVPIPAEEGQSLLKEFRDGLKTVGQLPWLWISILLFAISNVTLVGPYSVAMPFLVSDVLKADVDVLGILYAMFAVGYVLGGVWLGRQPTIRRRGLIIYCGATVAGVMLALFGLPVGVPVLIVAALINGAALEMDSLAWISALQEKVPREKLGRVSGVDTVGSLALLPVGFALAGLATEAWGPALVFLIGGGSTALLSLLLLFHPAIRGLD